MVREFSIVQSTVVDHYGLYRKRARKLGVVAEFFLLKALEGVLHQVMEIKPNRVSFR